MRRVARRLQYLNVATVLLTALGLYLLACTPQQIATARDVLAVQSGACCVVKARAGATPDEIRKACAVSDEVTPIVDAILAETQKRETGGIP